MKLALLLSVLPLLLSAETFTPEEIKSGYKIESSKITLSDGRQCSRAAFYSIKPISEDPSKGYTKTLSVIDFSCTEASEKRLLDCGISWWPEQEFDGKTLDNVAQITIKDFVLSKEIGAGPMTGAKVVPNISYEDLNAFAVQVFDAVCVKLK